MFDIVILLILILIFIICFHQLTYKRNKIFIDPLIDQIKTDMIKIDPRISKIDFYSSDESYTEDKQKIYLCLKNSNGEYYDYNMLMYVAIHECSHALTDVIDLHHVTPEFKGMFDTLLQKATKLGLYNSTTPLVNNYCGVDLDIKDMQR